MSKRKIVEIKSQVRNPQRKTLVFDNGSVFGISEDVFISNNFSIGDLIDNEYFDKINSDELKSKVYNSAIRLLGYRMRSCAELKGRLIEKKYPIKFIEETIDKLLKMGYLNDAEFAKAFAHDKVNSRKIGPIILRREFIPYEIASEIVESVIDEVYDKYPIYELIKIILNKKKIKQGDSLDQKSKKRIIDLLMRKGFTWNDILTVFTELDIKI